MDTQQTKQHVTAIQKKLQELEAQLSPQEKLEVLTKMNDMLEEVNEAMEEYIGSVSE
ncbi:MAG: hypothetical protein H8D63_02955 [Parcubacteria group bacterium]|nr:hypothetical protein [Parcubacteria group bacterium]